MAENDILSGMVDQSGGESDYKVTENPDGSADIEEPAPEKKKNQSFYRNLVEDLDRDELQTLSRQLLEYIEQDKDARKKRDEQVEEGKKRMGLSKETIGGANFEGASRVVHPMYTKASIDFEARAIKELFPPGGPVRQYMAGTVTDAKVDAARRKAQWMNYQLTQLMPNFRAELEQILINLPMDGNAYQKFIPPGDGGDIRDIGHEWIPVDEMLLPYAATNFYRAERRTHVQKMTQQEFDRRIRMGIYVNVPVHVPEEPGSSKTAETVAKIEGTEAGAENTAGLRVVYECDCLYEIRDPDVEGSELQAEETQTPGVTNEVSVVGPLPYLISIDETSKEVVSIYRNWDESDEQRTRLEWAVEWCFVPFRGAYSLGLPHIIGSLSIAATGALRALLDAAHITTSPGLIKLKGAAGTGQNVLVNPTEVTEIANSGEVDDVRKLIMAIPFKEPSPVLLTLLGLLGDQAEQVIRTTIDESESRGDVPVGTTLARIEQGMVAFSAIHSRLYDSMDRLLKVLHRINATWLEEQVVQELLGERLVTEEDFTGPYDVIPVADPNIFCEVQRYGQIQTVAQRAVLLAQMGANVYDMRKVEELVLKQMKLPNEGKDLLVQKPTPEQMNPVNENVALSLGRPIVAFPEQDQEAHITTHCDFFENPFFNMVVGSNPGSVSGLMQNLKEHVVFWYATKVHRLASDEATKVARERDSSAGEVDIGELPQKDEQDPEVAQMYDQMLAKASVIVMQQAAQDPVLKRASQTIQQLQQILKSMQPQMPDQNAGQMAAAQAKMMDSQLQHQDRQAATQEKSQSNQASNQAKVAIAQQHEQAETQRQQQADQTKLQTTLQDNQTAMGIEQDKMRNEQMNTMNQMQHEQRMGEQQHSQQMQQQGVQHQHQMQQGQQQHANQMESQAAQAEQTNVSDGESVGKSGPKPGKE